MSAARHRLPAHGGGRSRHSARRRRQRRRPAARGARRGPARTTTTHHPTAPLRPPPRAWRTRTASRHPLPGAGRSPHQPHESQLAIPPRAERGAGLIYCGGHQAVDYRRGAPRRRSLKRRRPRPPATSRQGARRGAHRRPPHTSPTTTDSTVIPWRKNAPSQNTHYAHPVAAD